MHLFRPMTLATRSRRHAHGALRVSGRHPMGCRRLTILQASFSPDFTMPSLCGPSAFEGNARNAAPALGVVGVLRSNVLSIVALPFPS
jgi:hypothetical protein